MNTNDRDLDSGADMADSLRWSLRGLRRDEMPQRDLWAGIAARIAAEAEASATTHVAALRPRTTHRMAWLATAASVALAVGIGWQFRPSSPATLQPTDATAMLMAREAEALTWEYQAALREIDANHTPANAAALHQIDRSAVLVRTALIKDPDSRFLLQRLQRLYSKRLELTQRLALT